MNLSDHYPISTVVKCDIPSVITPTKKVRYNGSKADLTTYKQNLRVNLESFDNPVTNIPQDIDMLSDDIQEAIIKATKSSVPISTYRPHVRPFWDNELDHLHKEQFNLGRIWIAQHGPRGMEHSSYANYKHAKRRFAKMFRDKQVTFIRSEYEEVEMRGKTDIKHLWRHVKPKLNLLP